MDEFSRYRQCVAGADAKAAVWLRRSVEANRNYPFAHFYLAVALAYLGEMDEARAAVQSGLARGDAVQMSAREQP